MIHLSAIEDIEQAIVSHRLCLFYIQSSDCTVCRIMHDRVAQVAECHSTLYSFYTDIAEEPLIASRFMVFSGPTVLLLLDGHETYRASQFIDLDELKHRIGQCIASL